jgi:hypothetical protein
VQLQAVGRLLDQRATAGKEICVVQAGGGFVVHLLRATTAASEPAFAPTTIVLEADEVQTAVDKLAAARKRAGWWGGA